MMVYIAAPIVGATQDMRDKINTVEFILNNEPDIEIYDPKYHSVPNAWGMSMAEWARCIFALDVTAIDDSDWVVVCDFGRQGTAGTAWECGYAFAKGKKVLIVQMEDDDCEYSVMTRGCSSNYCTYEDVVVARGEDKVHDLFIERGKKLWNENLN